VFAYRAAVRSQNVAARALQQIIERFCGGSVEQFLAGAPGLALPSVFVASAFRRKEESHGFCQINGTPLA
jgi:hypothetical protein